MSKDWNHNIHYHKVVLDNVPVPCTRALDVGCGQGLLAQQLSSRCQTVIGIDADPSVLPHLSFNRSSAQNVEFIAGNIMTFPFEEAGFTLITAVATLHHLPLESALLRFRDLLAPGGVLIIIGLYRLTTVADYLVAGAAKPTSWTLKRIKNYSDLKVRQTARKETLRELSTAARNCLPDSIIKRRLLFRYSLTWQKPWETAVSSGIK